MIPTIDAWGPGGPLEPHARQTCCKCFETTTDYTTQTITWSDTDRRRFHYCAGCGPAPADIDKRPKRPTIDATAYAYCDRQHPGGDAEAHDWHNRYHIPPTAR